VSATSTSSANSTATDAPRTTRRPPAWLLAAGAVVLLVVAGIVTGPPASEAPLDPRSAEPDGLRGVVDLLEGVGVDVEVSLEVPADPDTVAFVPVDVLGEERRDALLAWVREGGTLVVADPGSRLHGLEAGGPSLAGLLGATAREPACDLAALDPVDQVVDVGWPVLEVPDDGVGCFGDDLRDAAWLVARPEGEGTVVAAASATPFTNAHLDRADNAVLAAALLGPAPDDRLVVVPRPPVGEGDVALLDLVPDRFWRGAAVALLALLLLVLWRGRRLGRPVAETLPPVVASAELTRSVADLLQRAGSRDGAARQLRRDARRLAAHRLGLPNDLDAGAVAERVQQRAGLDGTTATTALVDAPVDGDDDLVAVARAVHTLRRALDHPDPRPDDPTTSRSEPS
jgi:hypothetical protein